VYLAISPLPLSLSIDLPCIYEIERESIMAKPFANHPNKKRKFNVVPSNFLMSSLKKTLFGKALNLKKKEKREYETKYSVIL